MKRFLFLFTLLFCVCSSYMYAQSTYKGVTITRDEDDKTVIIVINSNNNPVNVKLKYIAGHPEEPWRDFTVPEKIPANTTRRYSVSSKIYALDLTYVDILHENVVKGVIQFLSGAANNNNNNTNGQQ